MKLLMFDVAKFWYKPFKKTLENVRDIEEAETIRDALVVFVNVEKDDAEKTTQIIRKGVKNISWLARKTGRTRVVLHSFAHLSDSKADVETAQTILKKIEERLTRKGYQVYATPFGYFLEFKLHVRGESLAKVWKAIS